MYTKKANSNENLLNVLLKNNYFCNFTMLFLQKRKVKVAILIFNAFQTQMTLLLAFLFCVLQG